MLMLWWRQAQPRDALVRCMRLPCLELRLGCAQCQQRAAHDVGVREALIDVVIAQTERQLLALLRQVVDLRGQQSGFRTKRVLSHNGISLEGFCCAIMGRHKAIAHSSPGHA